MHDFVLVLVIIIAVLSRPIERRLWYAGRISDRTLLVLMLGRFPALCAVFALLSGASWTLVLALTLIGLIPVGLTYPFMRDAIHKQSSKRHSN